GYDVGEEGKRTSPHLPREGTPAAAVLAGMVRTMLQGLVSRARQLAQDLQRSLRRPAPAAARPAARPAPSAYGPLGRVLLTDGVGRTLFEEYADHRAAARGEEETGWVLVGLREASEAVVL